ncbi:hypothetical protein [Microbispora sp. NPDC049633]|uniref:hypothetical protein n=1 Tax=Microbispora sp. NPDC049633 TaxID=3154355 RepID=UPI00344320E9
MAIANYIFSPSFEHSSWKSAGGQVWEYFCDTSDTWSLTTSTTASKGTRALQLTTSGFHPGLRLRGLVLPPTTVNKQWTLSWDHQDPGSFGSSYSNVRIFNVTGTQLATTSIFLGSSYTRQSITFTQTPAVTEVYLQIPMGALSSGETKTWRIDGVRLSEGTSTTYVDGDTAGHTWAGTPGASQTVTTPTPDAATPTNVYNYWRTPHPSGTGWTASSANASVTDNGQSITAGIFCQDTDSPSTTPTVNSVASPSLSVAGLQANTTAYLSLDVSGINYSASTAASYTDFSLSIDQLDGSGVLVSRTTYQLDRDVVRQSYPFITAPGVTSIRLGLRAFGTSAARWMYATLDKIRIDTRADAAYIGGDTTGYMWQGQANSSYTVLGVKAMQASATITVTGTASESVLINPLKASAAITLTGQVLKVDKLGVLQASASLPTTGSATLVVNGAMAASAQMTATGSAPLYAIVPISASATTPTDGSASVTIAVQTATSAHIALDGSADLGMVEMVEISAWAHLPATGQAQLGIGLQMSARAALITDGSADLSDAVPKGAFGDFAVYGTAATDTDPLLLGRGDTNAGITTGATGQPWARVHATFHAPDEQAAWPRAAYAAVGFTFTGMGAGTYQEIGNVQVELVTDVAESGPSEYIRPQLIRPIVVPDRLNYAPWYASAMDPWFNDDGLITETPTAGPVATAHPASTYTINAGAGGMIGGHVAPLEPGQQYTYSVYVRLDGNMDDLQVKVIDNDTWETIASANALAFPSDENGWRRVVVRFTAHDDQFLSFNWAPGGDYPKAFSVTGTLVERGYVVGDYFELQPGSRDYFYADMGTDPAGGVFWYPNIDEREHLLVDALEEYAPSDVTVGAPEFGIHPHVV